MKIHYDKDGYEMISKPNGPVRIHRYIWEQSNGKIPDGHDIHHKNFIRTDNRIENLECILHKDHASLHAKLRTGDKNSFYGKKHKQETIIGQAITQAKHLYTLVNKINGYIYGIEMPVVYYKNKLGISDNCFYSMKGDVFHGQKSKLKNIIIYRTLKNG